MNRFVKQNLLLLVVMSVSCVVILVLLVYSCMIYFQMQACISETNTLRGKIEKLIRQKPAPVDGNKPLIQKNIDLYKELNLQLSANFGRPYQPAAERFVEVLMGVKKGENAEETRAAIEEARVKFVEEYNSTVGKDDNLARQGIAMDELRRKYRATWDTAVGEFRKMVTPLTQEPDLEINAEAMALSVIGIPRKMQNSFAKLDAYSISYKNKLGQLLGEKLRPEAEMFGIELLDKPVDSSRMSAVPGGDAAPTGPRVEDIPIITRHWDIIGDIVKRISASSIKSLNFFRVRGVAVDSGSFENTFTASGSYTVSHYSFEVTGSMQSIRQLADSFGFDPAQRRVYVVRSVFLYAPAMELALAKQLLEPVKVQEEEAQKSQESAPVPGRGGRRGRRAMMEIEMQPSVDRERETRQRFEEEMKRRDEKLPYYQRNGYGDVKLGGVEAYRAVFDIDYVALSSQQ